MAVTDGGSGFDAYILRLRHQQRPHSPQSVTTAGYPTQDRRIMKPIQMTFLLLASMTHVLAAPVADANIVMTDPDTRPAYHTSWVEDSTVSSRQPLPSLPSLQSRLPVPDPER
ncbi:hypothetical protein LZ31DRAFT_553544 [Colletotrichum somersetense]|nr:hypothetical protein LZ31DRAFT_553544 [Colletotrichum somersetense]